MSRITETILKTTAEILIAGAILWFVAVPAFRWAANAGWFGSSVEPAQPVPAEQGKPTR